jgi:hypothetical protein
MSQKRHWNFWAGAALLAVFAAYALWNARDLLGGAELSVDAPGTVRGDYPMATLTGSVGRAATHLSVNGAPVLTDERGAWRVDQLLRPGRNVFVVEARDRFGEAEAAERVVWYLPEEGA